MCIEAIEQNYIRTKLHIQKNESKPSHQTIIFATPAKPKESSQPYLRSKTPSHSHIIQGITHTHQKRVTQRGIPRHTQIHNTNTVIIDRRHRRAKCDESRSTSTSPCVNPSSIPHTVDSPHRLHHHSTSIQIHYPDHPPSFYLL